MDITSFINWFLDQFIKLFKFLFNTLDSITFNGISLLDYIITVFVLIPIVTTLFTLVTSDKLWNSKSERSRSKKEDKKNE